MATQKKNKTIPNIMVENAKILFRNFEGKEGRYNPAGRRNFCVLIENPAMEAQLKADGWNVKYLKSRDEEEAPQAYLKVNVSYLKIPPKIVIINDKRKTSLEEDDIHILDWAEIDSVDLIINPSFWENGPKAGLSAYVKTMYVTLKVNELERKYRDIPDSASAILLSEDD